MVATHNLELRRKNNVENFKFISTQMEADKQRRSLQREVDRQYYKPHFGPEETKELIEKEAKRVADQKLYVRDQLLDQMNMKAQIKLTDYAKEREGDLANIRTAQNIFSHEEKAKIDKKVNEK